MKKFSFIFSIIFFLSITTNAKIWRVNNMPGVLADFTTAQAAHDGASSGDTIHLEPSPTLYGSVTTSKKLVWISVGSFLIDNPGHQFSSISGRMLFMTTGAGSEGSVLSVIVGGINVFAPYITIIRTHITGGGSINIGSNSNDAVVMQSYCSGGITIGGANTVISNNIFNAVSVASYGTAIIINNIITGSGGYGGPIWNSVFQNNISRGILYVFSNSTVQYNLDAGGSIPAGNNNQLNVNMNTVFVNDGGSVDKDYQLKVGSPAIGSGYGGIDMGAFGGSTAFKLALQPAIPAITNLSSPSSSGGNTIQVTFSAKSNN